MIVQQSVVPVETRKEVNIKEETRRNQEEKQIVINEYQAELKGVQTFVKQYSDGSRFEGQLKGDARHGKGIYYYANGDIFVGEWKDDQFHGERCYYFF